jgi:hypothetical protein
MSASISTRLLSAAAALSVVALIAQPAQADVLEKSKRVAVPGGGAIV